MFDDVLSNLDILSLQRLLSGTEPASGINPGMSLQRAGTAVNLPTPESVNIPSTTADKLAKGLIDFGPLMAQIGASLMGGKETPMGQAGLAAAQSLQTTRLNEALKKALQQVLSGKEGFQGSQMPLVGLSSAEASGLTPEQLQNIYSTALTVREKELKRPLEQLATYGDLYNKIMTGQYHEAQIPYLLSQAQKHLAEAQLLPATNAIELAKKLVEINKANEEIAKLQAEKRKIGAETEKIGVETKVEEKKISKIAAETGKTLEELRLMSKENHFVPGGDRYYVVNKYTGDVVKELPIGPAPETSTKQAKEELALIKEGKQRAASLIVPILEQRMASTPEGKQKVELMNLLNMLRSPMSGEVDPSAVEAMLAKTDPSLVGKFNQVVDTYIKGLKAGFSQEQIGVLASSILGTPTSITKAGEAPKSSNVIVQGATQTGSILERGLMEALKRQAEIALAGAKPGKRVILEAPVGGRKVVYEAVKNPDGTITLRTPTKQKQTSIPGVEEGGFPGG